MIMNYIHSLKIDFGYNSLLDFEFFITSTGKFPDSSYDIDEIH